MSYRRSNLPQLHDHLFLADGGMETYLIFQQGIALPDFAAFLLLRTPEGEDMIRAYFRPYAEVARRYGTGLILETPTWRASADWGGWLAGGRHLCTVGASLTVRECRLGDPDSAVNPVAPERRGCLPSPA